MMADKPDGTKADRLIRLAEAEVVALTGSRQIDRLLEELEAIVRGMESFGEVGMMSNAGILRDARKRLEEAQAALDIANIKIVREIGSLNAELDRMEGSR